MIEIDGPIWFLGALIICGAHVLYLRSWRRERHESVASWQKYDAAAQARHEEFMAAIRRGGDASGWNLDGGRVRGQA